MTNIEPSGFSELDRLLELVRRTREVLDSVVGKGTLPQADVAFLAERTLPHFEAIRAGFHGWLRSDAAEIDELQYLIRQVAGMRVRPPDGPAEHRAAAAEAVAEQTLGARGSRADGPGLLRAEAWHLAALGHARVVLAVIPRLPAEAVRYRIGRRTYADIPIPRGPAELAARLEELEAELWRAATGRSALPLAPAFRRTYGFFDAADRLGLRAFLGAA